MRREGSAMGETARGGAARAGAPAGRVPRARPGGRHTVFDEVMAGTVGIDGEERPMRLELRVDLPELLRPWGDTEGVLTGRVYVPGWADDPHATGTLRVAPIAARRIRYRMEFRAADGRVLLLDGWKSVSPRRPLHSMTHLPATITDAGGAVVAEARLRFDVRRDLLRFLAGFRLPRAGVRGTGGADETGGSGGNGGRSGGGSDGSRGPGGGIGRTGETDPPVRDGPRVRHFPDAGNRSGDGPDVDHPSGDGPVADPAGEGRAGAPPGADGRPGWAAHSRAARAMPFLPRTVPHVRAPAFLRPPSRPPQDTTREVGELFRSRWRGQPGRLEVWYTTLTDPATGTGLWLHHELVAPADGGPARGYGWAALFPPGEPPAFARFGPERWPFPGGPAGGEGFSCAGVEATAYRLRGAAGPLEWDLTASGGGSPLYTFPRWAWYRELLPAAQIVPAPTAAYDGTVRRGDRVLELRAAPGGSARIYGHGNAERWAWLHADLGGGDVCEVVAAVSTRPMLNRLRPLPFVRLRVDGADWPGGDPLRTALRARAEIGLPSWSVRARSGDRAVEIEVTLPPGGTVAVDYADPDGRAAVCHNSELADARITLLRRDGSGRRIERRWSLDGLAHAEVGLR